MWRTGALVLRHTKRKLPRRNLRHAGVERRSHRQQFAACLLHLDERGMFADQSHTVALDRQRRALLIKKLTNACFAAIRVHHALGKQLSLTHQTRVHALRPAGADSVQCACTRRPALRPVQLRQDVEQMSISHHGVQIHRPGFIPCCGLRQSRGVRLAELTRIARAIPLAHARMCARQHITGCRRQFIDQPHRLGLHAIDIASAEDHLKRIADTGGAATLGQQPRQTLCATIPWQQPQPDLRLTEL